MIYTATVISAAMLGATSGALASTWAGAGHLWIGLTESGRRFFSPRSSRVLISAQSGSTEGDEIADAMPLMLDMLDVCATAGLSVDDSWGGRRATDFRNQSQRLCEEMQLVKLEVRLGKPRETALREMGRTQRCRRCCRPGLDVDSVGTLWFRIG